jgi:hypothetical protein
LPTIITESISSITDTTAIGGGHITSDGGSPITARGVCWNTAENPTTANIKTSNGTGTGTFTSSLTGLNPNTTYYVRAYATSSAGTGYGNQVSFNTNASLPRVITNEISYITLTSAQSGGNVISDEGATVTARGVCWSTSENPTLSDDYTIDSRGIGSFTSNITGLFRNTTYYLRAYATNSIGTGYGNELSFTTKDTILIAWQKSLGGSGEDMAYCVQQTTDGGYIIAGESESNDGDVSGNYGGHDYWIVKLNSIGDIDWQKSLGGNDWEKPHCIQQTTDGGYIIVGESWSNDGEVSGNHGYRDYWIVKLTSTGNIDWQKCLGGSDDESAYSIQQTTDGGYIIAGESESNDGDVSSNHGSEDYWIVKFTSTGNLDWQKSFGGSGIDRAFSIQQTTDGGYIIAGASWSNDGDVLGNHGHFDYWIVKLTSTGNIDWQKSLGGSWSDWATSIQLTTDGGYIIAGFSESDDGDVLENRGHFDYWILKLTSTGDVDWQKSIGESYRDEAHCIQETVDGGYIIAGFSYSNDEYIVGQEYANSDYWIVKLNSFGDIDWQKSLGGRNNDVAYSIQQTIDGGYIIVGYSESNDGDISGNHGSWDYWIVKIIEN